MFIERVKYYCVSLLCEKRSKLVRLNPKSLSPDLTKPKGHGTVTITCLSLVSAKQQLFSL